jgi:hypothetical protein
MRESLMSGSVRGARGNSRPYRDPPFSAKEEVRRVDITELNSVSIVVVRLIPGELGLGHRAARCTGPRKASEKYGRR